MSNKDALGMEDVIKEFYFSGKYADPHGELASRLGVERDTVKAMAYIYLYSTKPTRLSRSTNSFIKPYIKGK